MAWERRRNGHTYYYRAQREGDRVVKTYIGRGEKGRLAAAADEAARRSRAESKQIDFDKRHALDDLVAHLDEFGRTVDLIVTCQAARLGWKKDNRHWRSPRNG